MHKDIQIPKVKDVYIAVVQQAHVEYKTLDWNAYIINNADDDLEVVLIVSKGFSKTQSTPPMRHQISLLPARSFAKIEYLQEKVLKLNNEFKVTFFKGGQMYDKSFFFQENSINSRAMQLIPLMNTRGVLCK